MEIAYLASIVLSMALFFYYGLNCLLADGMVAEFERFGLSPYRRLTGSLEVLGALGLLVGFFAPPLMIPAAGGLALLMVLGVITRVRAGDSIAEMIPAIVLLLVNLFIVVHALRGLRASS